MIGQTRHIFNTGISHKPGHGKHQDWSVRNAAMGLARMQLRKYCKQGLAKTLAKNPLVGLLEHRIKDNKNPDKKKNLLSYRAQAESRQRAT
jgi:hypothetical protein